MMVRLVSLWFVLLALSIPVRAQGNQPEIKSPDGRVVVTFTLQDGGRPAYAIRYQGRDLVLPSRLGFPELNSGFEIAGIKARTHRGKWTNAFGERRIVPDNYREMNVDLRHASGAVMRVTFRAYDEGAALRYSFPEGQSTRTFRFSGESTEFRFPEGTYGYEEHGTEGEYARVPVGEIKPYCERPLTLQYSNGAFAALTEAGNLSYARMLLSPLEGVPGALVSALGGTTANTENSRMRHDPNVTLAAGESTPWRAFVVGTRPGDLLERNYLILNLAPASKVKDSSWIRPGTAMRDSDLKTANSKAIIDFAAKAGLEYVHLDARWYGSEDATDGDATMARAPELNLQEIIEYARQKGVGVWLYVDRRQVEKQRDVIFPLYEKWGVAGVKLGFVAVGPQETTRWLAETIELAARHHLMLNIHDGYRATGLERTYPHLMTVEGIRGNEHMPVSSNSATLPFTRYVSGVGDHTICYYNNRIKTTHAHQLALNVISFSKVQWVLWYDRPSDYQGEPELEFFAAVPTVWDETKVINGEIGQFATVARRSGKDWFIGTVNNETPRTLKLPLSFLEKGKKYVAHVYYDDETVPTRTHVGIERRPVDATMTLDIPLKANGGQAVRITPAR